jgi:radical SAM protein with 4Fe4S-binding SPASM domain
MIKIVQLDPNGLCNAKCWYCPVAYGGNPKIGKKNMDIDVLINILDQLEVGRGDFVDPNFNLVYSAHYNEIFLYPNFKEMIQTYGKYKLTTTLFSNGTTLNKDKIDFIKNYSNVVKQITLNIPSAFAEQWSQYTGLNANMFDKLIDNIKYAEQELVIKSGISLVIQVNGVEDNSIFGEGGSVRLLSGAPKLNMNANNGDVAKTINKFKEMFPHIYCFKDVNLNDRSGKLEENNILTNIDVIKVQAENFNKKVVGCAGGEYSANSRSEEWLHINANGDVILCCHDYDFKTSYINVKDKTIKEIWNGPERKEMIENSYKNFCTQCKYAIWK